MVRSGLVLAWFLLVLLLVPAGLRAAPPTSGTFPVASAPATMMFPSADLTFQENATRLVAFLGQSLGLPPLTHNFTLAGPRVEKEWEGSSALDSQGHFRQVNITTVYVNNGTPSIRLQYSDTGRLISASIFGPFGDRLASTDEQGMFDRLRDTARRLGIPIPDDASWTISPATAYYNGTLWTYVFRTVAVKAGLHGLNVTHGNELRMTFNLKVGMIEQFDMFPWFSAPSPAISPQQAVSTALDYLNRSFGPNRSVEAPGWVEVDKPQTFTNGTVSLTLDYLRYSLVFEVDAEIPSPYPQPPGQHPMPSPSPYSSPWSDAACRCYRLWVDAYDGSIVYWQETFENFFGGPPSGASPGPLVVYWGVGAAAALGLSALVFLERLRLGTAYFLLPLYFKLRRERALAHFVRGQVYGFVVAHPGAYYSEIRDALDLNSGTATHHLSVLVALGFLRSSTDGRHKRFFPSDAPRRGEGRRLSGLQTEILEVLQPGRAATAAEVARAVGISRQRARYNLRRMLQDGHVIQAPSDRNRYASAIGQAPLIPDREPANGSVDAW